MSILGKCFWTLFLCWGSSGVACLAFMPLSFSKPERRRYFELLVKALYTVFMVCTGAIIIIGVSAALWYIWFVGGAV